MYTTWKWCFFYLYVGICLLFHFVCAPNFFMNKSIIEFFQRKTILRVFIAKMARPIEYATCAISKLRNGLTSLKEKRFFYHNKRKKSLCKIKIIQYLFALMLFALTSYQFQVCFNVAKCLARNHQFWFEQRKLFQSTLKSGEINCFVLVTCFSYLKNLIKWNL